MNKVEDEILMEFLEKAATKGREEIQTKGTLSAENAIPLMLKSQYNHIMHLDTELTNLREMMVTKDEFKALTDRVKAFSTHTMIGLTIIGILIMALGIVMPLIIR